MSAPATAELLRPGLLDGVAIILAGAGTPATGPAEHSLRQALAESAEALSARLSEHDLPVQEEALAQRLREDGLPDLLVVDAAGVFAAAGEPARDALGRTMQLTWEVMRIVAGALIEQQRPGRIVLVAPAAAAASPDESSHARATRAGLENLARTTSIEWARYGITPVAITPGPATAAGTVAALCAYLASPAGAYFSGCVLALDGDGPPAPTGP